MNAATGLFFLGGLVFALVLLALLLTHRRHWLPLAVALLAFPLGIPLPFLDRFDVWHVFAVFLLAMSLGDIALRNLQRSRVPVARDLSVRILAVIACAVTIRVLLDRPGSSRLGESGGIGEATIFVIGIVAFFPLRRLAAGHNVTAKTNTFILVFASLALAESLIANIMSGEPFYMGVFYHTQMWMVAAFVLSLVAASERLGRSPVPWFALSALFFLSLAAITPHRSRPLFAIGNALLIGYVFGRFRKTILLVCAAVAVAFISVFATGSGQLPEVAGRSLSTIQEILVGQESLDERQPGWTDSFRSVMYDYAWEQIKSHPLMGKGFAFTALELNASLGHIDRDSSTGQSFTGLEAFAVAGVYHNAVIELVVFCGIPVGILFVIAYFRIVVRFLRWGRALPNASLKVFAAGVAGYLVQATGQMLMNGSGEMLGQICVLLGVMSGIMLMRTSQKAASRRGGISSFRPLAV